MNVVKELIGHAASSTTADSYSTVSEEHEAMTQWSTEAIMLGGPGTTSDVRGRNRRKPQRRLTLPCGDNLFPDKHFR